MKWSLLGKFMGIYLSAVRVSLLVSMNGFRCGSTEKEPGVGINYKLSFPLIFPVVGTNTVQFFLIYIQRKVPTLIIPS